MRIKLFLIMLLACAAGLAAPEPVERQAERIRTLLEQADDAYFNRGEPIMADEVYDALRGQYETLCAEYPELNREEGAAAGAAVPERDSAVEHTVPILSLDKAYSDEEVEAFIDRCGRDLNYCIEPKIDGLTIVLRYRDGQLNQALTRGDGRSGKDVTEQVIASGAVPLALTNALEKVEVRGELCFSFDAFDKLNTARSASGLEPLKSPRNCAAGTLRLKNLNEVKERGLSCRIFDWIDLEPNPPTHMHALAALKQMGLPVIDSRSVPGGRVLETIQEMNREREQHSFATDGIVIRLDDEMAYRQLATTSRFPRGALARKYRPVPVETRLLRVEWMQGETGRLTPVAYFEPVEVDGATLQRASLHGRDHLRALDLMIGDRIQVIRAGGAIPEIIGRSPAARTGDEVPIPDPETVSGAVHR